MPTSPRAKQLMDQVAARMRWVEVARAAYVCSLAFAGVLFAALVLDKMGVLPWPVEFWHVALVPAAGLALGAVVHRPVQPLDGARRIDQHEDTKDLFLTAALLEKSPGAYQPLVQEAAEKHVGSVRPAQVVPFDGWPKTANALTALALLALLAAFGPRFDPFRKAEVREKLAARERKLEEDIKKIAARKETLEKKGLEGELSKPVDQAMAELRKMLADLKPTEQQRNDSRIQQHQEKLADMLGQMRKDQQRLRDQAGQQSSTLRLAAGDTPKTEQWKKELAAGDTSSLQKELAALQAKAKQLQEEKDPAKQEQLRKELKQGLQEAAQFTAANLQSPGIGDAMQKALQQLDMSAMDGAQQQAMQNLQQAMELAQMEAKDAAQMMRDMQQLQQAMQTAQQARQCNGQSPLNGGQTAQMKAMSEYQKHYQQQMGCNGNCKPGQCKAGASSPCNKPGGGQGQGQGQGNGPLGSSGTGQGQGRPGGSGGGMGAAGIGQGGKASENPNAQVGFKKEQSKSAVTAGKTLLKWKTSEVIPDGEARKEFAEQVAKMKSGASEAILAEEIPPGYHDAIRKYFDKIAPEAGAAPAPDGQGAAEGKPPRP